MKLIGLAFMGLFLLSVGCKKTTDSVEESLGEVFSVHVDGNEVWSSSTDNATIVAKMDGSRLKITLKNGNDEVVLYTKNFEKGEFLFDDTSNTGLYKASGVTYNGAAVNTNNIKISNIHADGKKFDATFSFAATDKGGTKVITGSWINV